MSSSSSINALQPLRRCLAQLAPWVLVALLFAGIAHASHLHEPGANGRTDALHCGLCLQFERLAGAPSAPIQIASVHVVEWLLAPPLATPPFDLAPSQYDARGPPRS